MQPDCSWVVAGCWGGGAGAHLLDRLPLLIGEGSAALRRRAVSDARCRGCL